ncbi:helix-turn-helix transcriptional regulator, partial [Hominifimenecus microfluidus]
MGYVNIDSDIGKTLRKYRRERGITQEELAVALNMGMTTISAYENGRIMPTPDIVSQLMAEMSKERPTSWA